MAMGGRLKMREAAKSWSYLLTYCPRKAVLIPTGMVSAVDLVKTGRIPGLLRIAGMELALSELFGGRKVDLRTAEDLSPYFRAGRSIHSGSSI